MDTIRKKKKVHGHEIITKKNWTRDHGSFDPSIINMMARIQLQVKVIHSENFM
jgi:hypothetical protein